MKQTILIGLILVLGIAAGAWMSPIFAQQDTDDSHQQTCTVGERSNAVCAGDWLYFAGNTSNIDVGAWFVRINVETGEIWYKNGKKLVHVEED